MRRSMLVKASALYKVPSIDAQVEPLNERFCSCMYLHNEPAPGWESRQSTLNSLVASGLGEHKLGVDPAVRGLARVLVRIVLKLHHKLREKKAPNRATTQQKIGKHTRQKAHRTEETYRERTKGGRRAGRGGVDATRVDQQQPKKNPQKTSRRNIPGEPHPHPQEGRPSREQARIPSLESLPKKVFASALLDDTRTRVRSTALRELS